MKREKEDPDVDDPYQFTTFIDLADIINKNWGELSKFMPLELSKNRRESMEKLRRLNAVRNRVMHPVKKVEAYEEDYRFSVQFLSECEEAHWRHPDVHPISGSSEG